MPRHDWSHEERDAERRARERRADDLGRDDLGPDDRGRDDRGPEDFGQADYSTDYAYDPVRRTGYRAEDYGQTDYANRDILDPASGHAYRRPDSGGAVDRDYGRRLDEGAYRRDERASIERTGDQGRSWRERAGGFFGGRPERDERAARRRNGPSDRVLWAVIVERLEDERGLDLRDVEVLVENGEVTLNGTVRRKSDKRRIEDIADIDGVRNVQNNLRPRERGWF